MIIKKGVVCILVMNFPMEKLSLAEDKMENNDLLVNLLRKEGIKVKHIILSSSDREWSLSKEDIDLIIGLCL